VNYRKVGKWGLVLSELSLGSWLTFGNQLKLADVKEIVHIAFENGITFFDTAEAYNGGVAEYLFGQVLKDFNRMDYVVSTKIFWWGPRERNQHGLSKKHLVEGLYNSLKRLQLDYVDIVYCHRPDPETPLEEVVSAMDYMLRQGMALYWGTSEWPADKIRKAAELSRQIGILPPIVEQPQYNMFVRERVEKEYLPAYEDPGIGLTTFSPLASGLLTGKYINGIPKGSRLDQFPQVKKFIEEKGLLSEQTFEKIKKLNEVAKKLDASLAQLAIAWVLKNEFVTSVILGVSRKEQLVENLESIEVKDRLTSDIMEEIESILNG